VDAASHWLTTPSRAQVDSGPVPHRADVVVVGGGLLGMCCAYWLARAGRRPMVLERNVVASGATGRNSGLVIPTTAQPYQDAVRRHGSDVARAVRGLAVDGASLLGGIVEEERISCGYRSAGLVQLALDEHQSASFADEIAASRAHGFDAWWLDCPSLQRRIGTPLGDRIVGGMYVPGALTNSVALVDGIASAARRRGARVHTGVRVTALRTTKDGVRVETTAGPVVATTLVAAVNAWLAELVPQLRGVIRPVQGQLIATTAMPPAFPFGVAVQLSSGGEYWQQTPDGTIVLGGCRCVVAPPADPTAHRPQPEVHRALLGVLPELFPAFGPVEVVRGWAGAMAFTADALPVVDTVDGSIWAVGGFNGHGMPFGASIGRLIADSVATGTRAPGLAPFRVDRSSLSSVGPHDA
jgi:glycine/D-amino acid oxidase-like deaminating enzyme